ncbi:hypothetical protein B0T17DRAFT_523189 [Bombardia bombarda]|uniref:FAD-binding PCMH-type domain-containing protein n=1 Tax=Bombardia bombarda TaxID=252184 RepID=A0AA39X7L7_9PEZI|nr:hypothetical protein B0T17DRAFT_523189 [Bombardia bombarda]
MSSSSSPLGLVLLSILLLFSPVSTTAVRTGKYNKPPPLPLCKAIPGAVGWPSPQSWARLNESTGGRLLQPPPPGAVCHPGQPTYSPAACPAVQAGWSTYDFHQADPISTDWNQWNNDSCLPVPSDRCGGQGYPVYVINATTARHVKLGMDFATRYNVRLVVKSTGHDYIGRSVAPNSLSIWVHHMKGIQTHDSFRPQRCNVNIDSKAVTVAGGVQMMGLYTALNPLNQTVVGGNGRTVSVGGYLTGGGHGLLSARYGLGADQVLEMEVVTPTGDIVTANECQNTDLFWAMRGGGGSTFGILTSATIKTFPSPQIVNLLLGISTTTTTTTTNLTTPSSPLVPAMIAYVLSRFPSLGDRGLSGYSLFSPSPAPNPFDGGATTASGIFMQVALQDSTVAAMTQLWAPVLSHINATWPGVFSAQFVSAVYPSFYAWYQDYYDQSSTGTNNFIVSRLLDAKALAAGGSGGDLGVTAEALRQFSAGEIGTAYLVAGRGVHEARPRGGGNAVCPAWRKAYVHATLDISFPPLNPAARADAIARANAHLEPLRRLAPDSGAYMNEANPEEPDWQHQFWGANYERLVRIKRAVDPDDVLWCTPCVGNERWHEVNGQLCRV